MDFTAAAMMDREPDRVDDDGRAALWWLDRGYLVQVARDVVIDRALIDVLLARPFSDLEATPERPIRAFLAIGRAQRTESEARSFGRKWFFANKRAYRAIGVVAPTSNRMISMAARAASTVLRVRGVPIHIVPTLYALEARFRFRDGDLSGSSADVSRSP